MFCMIGITLLFSDTQEIYNNNNEGQRRTENYYQMDWMSSLVIKNCVLLNGNVFQPNATILLILLLISKNNLEYFT